MPPLPKKKHSRARHGGRNAHKRLRALTLSECAQCHSPKLPHHVCPTCGFYNGQEVVPADSSEQE